MKASDVMVSDVITAGPDTSVEEVARTLLSRRISALPVVDDTGTILGIISEGDLMRRAESGTQQPRSWWLQLFGSKEDLAKSFVKENSRKARDVMTAKVVTITPDTDLGDVAGVLERNAIKRVPVVSNGKLVGIVSRANLLQGFASIAGDTASRRETLEGAVDDATLRRTILEKLRAEPWAPQLLNVTVVDGVVDIWGSVGSDAEKSAVNTAIADIPGVKKVNDNLWIAQTVLYDG